MFDTFTIIFRRDYTAAYTKMKTDDKEEDSPTWSVDYNQAESMIPSSLYNLLAFILNENCHVSYLDNGTGRVKLQESLKNKTGSRLTLNEGY